LHETKASYGEEYDRTRLNSYGEGYRLLLLTIFHGKVQGVIASSCRIECTLGCSATNYLVTYASRMFLMQLFGGLSLCVLFRTTPMWKQFLKTKPA
jgi:hypothetical protein